VPGGKMYHCRIGSAEYMQQNFAQVEDFCRIAASGALKIVVDNEEYFDKPQIIATSRNFFSFFSYKLLTNNQSTAIESNNKLVISSALAEKYFGKNDPIGKIISFVHPDTTEQMMVSGIFEKPLDNTQIGFDMVRLIGETDSRCYIRLTEKARKDDLELLFKEKKETIPVINSGTPGSYYLEPLNEAYFNVSRAVSFERSRDRTDLLIALIIGIIIISVASFNYLGLLNNNLIEKNKEYHIRRINGGSKISFILNFMTGNLILIALSFGLSLFLMNDMIPFFNELSGSNITLINLFQTESIFLLFGIVLVIILIALLFTIFRIESNINTDLFRHGDNQKIYKVRLPVFNILQLASSVALIICSIIIIKQMNFINDKAIGLDKEVIEVKLPGRHKDKITVFKEELLMSSSIENVSEVGTSPVLEHFLVLLKYQEDGVEKQYSPAGFSGDENYLSTLGIELIEGSDFSSNLSSNTNKCIINESFVKLFNGQDLLGKNMPGMKDKIVLGIVKDFHYSGLKSNIGPAFISFSSEGSHLMVKGRDNQNTNTRETIEKVWKELIPDYPVNIESIGDRFEWFHRENKNYIRLIGACSLISIFLAMIGLFAISYQSSFARTKEIGIHKINGARIADMILMLNKEFMKWIMFACIIAWPAAWYVMHKWLQNFAFKTGINWWIFALGGGITLVIALLTVSWQSVRAATRNPVEALRYE